MPVRSRSERSRLAIHFLPSRAVLRSPSRRSSNPSLIRPPSLRTTGGSSETESAIRPATSSTSTSSDLSDTSLPERASSRTSLSPGTASRQPLTASRSRAFALPCTTRAIRRSRSLTSSRADASEVLKGSLDTASSTASCLADISRASIDGSTSHLRRRREPIGVSVRSRTERSVPSEEPSLTLRTTSRFLRVVWSSTSLSDVE